MRYVFILILTTLSCTSSAQRAFLDLSAGAHYSFRTLTLPDQPGRLHPTDSEEQSEIAGLAGVHYSRRLGERYGLRTGLRLTVLGYRTKVSGLRWGEQHDGSGGFDPTLDPSDPLGTDGFTRRTDRILLEVPLLWQQTFGSRTWEPYLEAGLLPGAYLTTRTRVEDGTQVDVYYFDEAQDAVRRFQLSAALSLGVARPLSERHDVFVQVNGRYQITALAKGPIKERLFAVGIELGVRRGIQ